MPPVMAQVTMTLPEFAFVTALLPCRRAEARLEVFGQFGPNRRLRVERPIAEAALALEAKPSLLDQLDEVGRRRNGSIERGKDKSMDRARQVEADKIRVFERPEHGEASAETQFDDVVDRFGVANPFRDQRDRLAPESVLQAVANKAGRVFFDLDRRLAEAFEQRHRGRDGRVRRLGGP